MMNAPTKKTNRKTSNATAEADLRKGQHVAAARGFIHYSDLAGIVTFIEEGAKE